MTKYLKGISGKDLYNKINEIENKEKVPMSLPIALFYFRQDRRLSRPNLNNEWVYLKGKTFYIKSMNTEERVYTFTSDDILAEDWFLL